MVTGTWPTGSPRPPVTCSSLSRRVRQYHHIFGATPAGWTQVENTYDFGAGDQELGIFVRVATGGDAAPTFTATMTGTAADCNLAVVLYDLFDYGGGARRSSGAARTSARPGQSRPPPLEMSRPPDVSRSPVRLPARARPWRRPPGPRRRTGHSAATRPAVRPARWPATTTPIPRPAARWRACSRIAGRLLCRLRRVLSSSRLPLAPWLSATRPVRACMWADRHRQGCHGGRGVSARWRPVAPSTSP